MAASALRFDFLRSRVCMDSCFKLIDFVPFYRARQLQDRSLLV